MQEIKLDKKQSNLYEEVKQELQKVKKEVNSITRKDIKDLGKMAHDLHISLEKSGYVPRHHNYMLENRGVSPDNVKFYEHIHPVEDLLKFIEDPTANVDPTDQTIGEEFNFRVYSKRQGHYDNYKIKRTKNGWDINFFGIGGSCDKSGYPYLFKNFEQDMIEYPSSLGERMEWLWRKAKDKGLTKKEVQEAINELADWVSNLEKNQPVEKVWQEF